MFEVVNWADLQNSSRSLLGNVTVGEAFLTVFPETSRLENSVVFDHFFIYTESSLATVSDVNLLDLDLDLEELGGDVSWTPPVDASRVQLYRAFLALDSVGLQRSQIGEDIAAPQSETNLSAEQPLANFTHLVVYTASQLVEQTTPNASAISDTVRVVSKIHFDDYDLDLLEVGGDVQWSIPIPSSHVDSYRVAFGTIGNSSVNADSVTFALLENEIRSSYSWSVGATLAVTAENFTAIPAETPLEGATHLLVFASSRLAEQQTPRAFLIDDTLSRASGVFFRDFDLDVTQLGGDVTWLEPTDVRYVMQYVVYLAASNTDRLQIAPVPSSGGRNQIQVYTQSTLAEQTTPAVFAVSDLVAMASNLSFDDYDLDATDLGGTLTWTLAENEALVTHYMIYFAQSCDSNVTETLAALLSGSMVFTVDGATMSQVEAAVIAALALEFSASPGDVQVSITTANQRRLRHGEARRLAAKTWLVLLTSMVSAAQAQQTVSATSFMQKLGPELVAQGLTSAAVASLVLIDFSSVTLTGVLVNSLPTLLPWNGIFNGSNVSMRYLDGEDSDGSTQSWESDSQIVTYLCNLEYFGNVTKGVNNIVIPAETWRVKTPMFTWFFRVKRGSQVGGVDGCQETPLENFTHFAIFTRSSVAEASVAASLMIEDANASVSSVQLPDEDLDDLELGGSISWVEPEIFASRVEQYRLYFSDPISALTSVQRGQSSVALAANTPKENFEALLVYTVSRLVEQSTPAYAKLSDTYAVATNLSFPDLDLDFDDLGGNLTWVEPTDDQFVEFYAIYQALPLEEALPLGLCAAVDASTASISGTIRLTLDGVTAQQLAALGIPLTQLVVTVTPTTTTLSRRLSTLWEVTYQASVSTTVAQVASEKSKIFNVQPQNFAVQLSVQLQVIGIDASSLIIQDFSEAVVVIFSTTNGTTSGNASDNARLLRSDDSDEAAEEVLLPARRLSSEVNLTAWCRGPLMGTVDHGDLKRLAIEHHGFARAKAPFVYAFDDLSRGELEAYKRRARVMCNLFNEASMQEVDNYEWLIADVSRSDFGERVADEEIDQGVSLRDSALVEIGGDEVYVVRVALSKKDEWLKSKEETKGDPRVLGFFTDSQGRRFLDFSQAIDLMNEFAFDDWPLSGPRAVLEFLKSVREGSADLVGYHLQWSRNSGISQYSAALFEHRVICDSLKAFITVDQIDPSSLLGVEYLVRRLIQIETAVSRNPSAPDYGLEVIMEGGIGPAGEARVVKFQEWIAARLKEKAQVQKQSRLFREEFGKKRSDGDGGDQPPKGRGRGRGRAKSSARAAASSDKPGTYEVISIMVRSSHTCMHDCANFASFDLSPEMLLENFGHEDSNIGWGSECDVSDCFYQFEMPELSKWFGIDFPKQLKWWKDHGINISSVYDEDLQRNIAVDDNTVLYPAIGVMPMGWTWALFFANETVAAIARLSSPGPGLEIREKLRVPQIWEGKTLTSTYVDNVAVFGANREEVQDRIDQLNASFKQCGIPVVWDLSSTSTRD
eukprot:symbB.v1.2.012153.t1/scaffold793.1/size162056/2